MEEVKEENLESENNEEVKEETSKESKKVKKDKFESLKDENENLKKQIESLKNDILKVKAEEINFKKRIEDDKEKTVKYANQKILDKFVSQIDLFDKVVSMKTDDPVLKNYLMGFEMINNNFKQILDEEGVKKIIVNAGDKLDAKYHEAFQTAYDPEYEEGCILAELRTGYTYHDRVLRTTLVKVNKKEEGKINE